MLSGDFTSDNRPFGPDQALAAFAGLAEADGAFQARHIGPAGHDVETMLRSVGADSLETLAAQTLPADIRLDGAMGIGPGWSETEVLARLSAIAARNTVMTSLIGQGYYGTVLPAVIQRNVLENPAWYTAYTPYQPEISQGRLEALLNFQTMVTELTGLDIANASLLDEATAAAEAMALAHRVAKSGSTRFFVDEDCHPQTIAVLKTRAEPMGFSIVVGSAAKDLRAADVFGALVQYPGSSGAGGRPPRGY
jgi:glycine dehydrogenase